MTKKIHLTILILFLSAVSARAEVTQDLLDKTNNESESGGSSWSFVDIVKNIFNQDAPNTNINVFRYNSEQSYPVKLKVGVATAINLPEDEKIAFFSTGNSNVFKIKYDEKIPNFLSVTTLSDLSESNLIVKTDVGSVYNFFLTSNLTAEDKPNFTTYVIRNKDQEDSVKEKILLRELQDNNDYIKKIQSLDKLNTSYRVKGDQDIAPVFVYDDGKWTYFDFGKSFVSDRLPNAYKIVDEYDSVINTRVKGNLLIAQSLSVEGFTLKNGEKYVCIRPKKPLQEVYKDERFN